MGDIERFLLDNLQVILVIAFILLPLLLNRKKLLKKRQAPHRGPSSQVPTGTGPEKPRESLEDKVRKFFDELVDEKTSPRPVARSPYPRPQKEEPLSMEDAPLPETVVVPETPREIPLEQGLSPSFEETRTPFPSSLDEPHHGPSPVPDTEKIPWADKPAATARKAEVVPDFVWEKEKLLKDREFHKREPVKHTVEELAAKGWAPGQISSISLRSLNRWDLRKAIVLKEVLDPPVAFRLYGHRKG